MVQKPPDTEAEGGGEKDDYERNNEWLFGFFRSGRENDVAGAGRNDRWLILWLWKRLRITVYTPPCGAIGVGLPKLELENWLLSMLVLL